MSIWREIKKTLNSTLGTEKFQSLDKLIGGKSLIDIFANMNQTLYTLNSNSSPTETITNAGGGLAIIFSSSQHTNLSVTIDGGEAITIKQGYLRTMGGSGSDSYTDFPMIFHFNETISFTMGTTGGTGYYGTGKVLVWTKKEGI